MEEPKTQKIYTLDERGKFCPVPVIKVAEKIREVEVGAIIKLISDDPGVYNDMQAWCEANNHKIIGHMTQDDVITIYIQKNH
jgi:tRNA 2-thiouridine synthesizing protein A